MCPPDYHRNGFLCFFMCFFIFHIYIYNVETYFKKVYVRHWDIGNKVSLLSAKFKIRTKIIYMSFTYPIRVFLYGERFYNKNILTRYVKKPFIDIIMNEE